MYLLRELLRLSIILPFLSSFILTSWIFPFIVKLAVKKDIVDCPNARKLQKTPIPVMGGFAIYFGIIVGAGVTSVCYDTTVLFSSVVAMTMMMYLGLMDDTIGLSPLLRIFFETALVLFIVKMDGVCLDSLHGVFGIYELPKYVALPLSVIAGVGIVNAINMIDGVDGLSSIFCMVACFAFGSVFKMAGEGTMAVIASLGLGAIIPFCMHNIFGRKSKMFIGDCGTMMMGMLMTIFVLHIMDNRSWVAYQFTNLSVTAFALSVLSVPVFDTLRVMTGRIMRGISPFHADKSHLHHLFIEIGFSHVGTALTVNGLNLCNMVIWFFCYHVLRFDATWQFLVVVAVGTFNTCGVYYIVRHMNHQRLPYRLLRYVAIKSHVEVKPWFAKVRRLVDYKM